MKNEEILKKIMDDHNLSAREFGRKIGRDSVFVSEISSGKISKISPNLSSPAILTEYQQFEVTRHIPRHFFFCLK